ncbi:MAG: ABC transporter ATP-binding protein [Chloroflexota bacterium]
MTATLLQAQDVQKHYGRIPVLRGASLTINPGEIVGLVGENGSGKSTFMNILVGLLRQDGGSVQVNCQYAYCPQDALVFDGLTMKENIVYFSAAYGLSAQDGLARGEALLERLNCRKFESQPAGQLSGGTRQKLNLIISLLRDPDLLFLDEPYQGFDYESYLIFLDLVKEMAEAGRSALVVSHMVHDHHQLSRIYKMQEGRTVHD